ncbi:hypothetical protein GW17_00020486 [Ensete ventricosum]|nr:hypothetical protein GW17_00020486 [Ensete ventricosum]RZS17778.1 hypothetical protein BHM03_00049982 [Ensete ventricosum]
MRSGAGFAPASSSHGRTFRSLDLFLRLTVIPLSAASLWVMATNKQANDAYGKVEFSNITGLKYLVCTNAISLGYAAASSLLSFLGCFNSDWLFFITDQVMESGCIPVFDMLLICFRCAAGVCLPDGDIGISSDGGGVFGISGGHGSLMERRVQLLRQLTRSSASMRRLLFLPKRWETRRDSLEMCFCSMFMVFDLSLQLLLLSRRSIFQFSYFPEITPRICKSHIDIEE